MSSEAKVDLTSIEALRKEGIIISGNSARRSDPEASISSNAKAASDILSQAIDILSKKRFAEKENSDRVL